MQISTVATNNQLAAALAAATEAIRALEAIDVSATRDAAVTALRGHAHAIEAELQERGLRECGRCRIASPGAVDWGCTCGMTADELAREAAAFARIHD